MVHGSMVALATPFRNGEVDADALAHLVQWHIDNRTQGIVALGTTGEADTLTQEEYRLVLKTVTQAAGKRLPIIAGATSNNPVEAIELAQMAQACDADGILCAAGYYLNPTQEGLYQHLKAVHDHSELPLILYNIPPRTIADLQPKTVARLANLERVVGIKDATKDLSRVTQERLLIDKPFDFLSGEDKTAPAYNAQGGHGCISVTANIAPKLCYQLQEACERGDFYSALEVHERLMPLHLALFLEPSPAGIKFAMSELGLCRDEVRIPFVPVNEKTKTQIRKALTHIA
ncbi:MAG: 4-hydroxy-tetrahydrodipicolinate synthase [Reinekea sp.]